MKYITGIIAAMLFTGFITVSFSQNNQDEKKDVKTEETKIEAKGVQQDDGVLYGAELNAELKETSIADLITKPDEFTDKVIKISGDITDVCQAAGCWIVITDGTNTIRVSTRHKFFLPKDATGKTISEGTFKVVEETEEHAKEMNKESRNPTMKTEDIKGPQKVFVIQATGIKLLK
jgi:polygalacturonase